ncbi:MAG: ABC transporter ATP-binding protein [Chloroflexota bacterium]|nr:ABC transporter ATP-binding protein [Chloroflexota bacterium]
MNRPAASRPVSSRLQTARHTLRAIAGSLRTAGRGVALIIRPAPAAAAVYLGLIIFLALVPVLGVWLSKLLMEAVTAGASGTLDSGGSVIVLGTLFALTLVLPAGLKPIQEALSASIENRAVGEVDRRLMRAGSTLVDLYRVEHPSFRDELHLLRYRAAIRGPRLLVFLQRSLPLLTLIGLLILLARLHPLLPLLLTAVAVPHLIAEEHYSRRTYQAMIRQARPAREMDYCGRLATQPSSAKEVRVFGLGGFLIRRFQGQYAAALGEMGRIRYAQLRVTGALGALYALTLAGGFWYVAAQAGAGRLTLGDVVLYLGAVIQVELLTSNLTNGIGHLYQALLPLQRLFEFLDRARPTIKLAPPGQGHAAPAAGRAEIELRQVGFRYPESTQAVLDDVSAVLPAGKVTALVGANGAGKSTLVKLLTRMYDPDAGGILLDGIPLDEYDLASWRRRIAVVYQDFAQFALTLRENIAVGAFAIEPAEGNIERAARWAGTDEVAATLPQGYGTQLTRRFEGGLELSGGEWQKVALARGFVRDAALVILDEPTAALDAEAEYRLFAQFRELVRGKTALIISHRFSTVRMADHIVVLDEGRVIEAGSHAALVAQGGHYAALYEMQAGRYR